MLYELQDSTCYVFYSVLLSTVAILFMIRAYIKIQVLSFLKNISRRSHAFASYALSDTYNQAVTKYKKTFFDQINSDLRKNNGEIYELGAGSGGNLDFYPNDIPVKMTAIDPNEFCKHYLLKNLQNYKNVEMEKYILNPGEELKDIPSDSVSLLITTIVLCSVENPTLVLEEIKRVLKPGGKFYFMEHVCAPKGTSLNKFQQLFSPFWSVCFDGCNLNRDTGVKISQAGFTDVTMEKFEANLNYMFKGLRPHVFGCAVK